MNGSRLPAGTVVEVLDADYWIRAVVDESGVVAKIDDPFYPNARHWEVPLALTADNKELAREWRFA
jgi:hypothetical protein